MFPLYQAHPHIYCQPVNWYLQLSSLPSPSQPASHTQVEKQLCDAKEEKMIQAYQVVKQVSTFMAI